MGEKVELIVFDWDGTLMDSQARIVESMQAAARDVDVVVPEVASVTDIIGLGLPEALERLFPQASQHLRERLVERYRHYFLAKAAAPMSLFPGVRETLQQLHDEGYYLAIATGKGRRGLDRVLEETDLAGLFSWSRCADETTSKPDPRMLVEIITESGASREATVLVGDTEYDMQMANAARTTALAVSYGVHSKERLLLHRPSAVLDQITEIVPWLGAHLNRRDVG